jgi:hypothetical protein
MHAMAGRRVGRGPSCSLSPSPSPSPSRSPSLSSVTLRKVSPHSLDYYFIRKDDRACGGRHARPCGKASRTRSVVWGRFPLSVSLSPPPPSPLLPYVKSPQHSLNNYLIRKDDRARGRRHAHLGGKASRTRSVVRGDDFGPVGLWYVWLPVLQ